MAYIEYMSHKDKMGTLIFLILYEMSKAFCPWREMYVQLICQYIQCKSQLYELSAYSPIRRKKTGKFSPYWTHLELSTKKDSVIST